MRRNKKEVVGKFCKKVYNKINEEIFKNTFRKQMKNFTRKRKYGFAEIMIMLLNKTGKSLRTGIRAFMKHTNKRDISYSKQALSKSRQNIMYEAFQDIFKMSVEEFYNEFEFKTFNSYRVLAIDGTKLNLPYHPDSIEEFGIQPGHGVTIQALGSCLYDVMNGIIIDALLDSCNGNERELAKKHIDHLLSIKHDKELLIFDRGYPSAELLQYIEEKGFKYLMRCDQRFSSGMLDKLTGNDCVIEHKFVRSKIQVKLRFIKFPLPNSEEEYLITNLFDEEFTVENFGKLYHMRWNIETNYDDVKNKLEIEDFSGVTPLAIRQDFYAVMFLRNLASMMVAENEDEINELHNSGCNKYEYKANINNVVSILKGDLVAMLVTSSQRKSAALFKRIQDEISRAVVPIRPDRSFPRSKNHFHSKFSQNSKS